ncbi:Thiamine-phosphate synthase [Candidatus Ornithobacterium hominis]|uniref:Thiamine-phosphate synthase n=1 Tax=Candidatus Ornithobacterium hominis TaxID=2497989 RepID=A0A383U4L5_9FLAO|nr:thiamine phosphate synthase [Candidatus Ornithobacterium hominis]MCT7905153.1 thiamine phosphate synthase [Candidatus Ornithobacterium hominis]SZD74226.1 Thiamine-phosphate synthase [Candidatus Ornithobacterium hominis]
MVYYISQGKTPNDHLQNIKKMVDAGVNWVQLRIKGSSANEILDIAQKAKEYCHENQVVFIINDDIQIAKLLNSDGVHLGREDESPQTAKELLGNEKIIGGTANTWDDCQKLIQMRVDYIGLGPFRFTLTKEKLSPILGIEGFRAIMNKIKESKIDIPVIAIGGIRLEDIEELVEIGISGVALSGFLHEQENIATSICQLQSYFKI